ncbi:FAD-dependent monooxygenase [Shewanella sp. D64]|uniref:FAD-dependent oxidoreductase n=1 Tax=unclassified Shewanella TaxID=196818 RepID=UPI0022BA4C2D|nr:MULTISPECIES: NAD(P)/FAD-dependent oxidoreductase [unclassified Shewanella]MEC4727087.1 FAD-dependent monooxygenase [Shewanella sp. D64]MEC4737826.1 FAD-dependent monooxygenase [Shewanella sp. E94]WBJ93918.1 FAD-dependent monooxygenase [Shewanella sp. MTB7]
MDKQVKNIAVAGAGPVGALLSVMLAKQGYKVDLFESRVDSRKASIYQGKSINLALSDRGWLALQAIGLDKSIRQHAIPMYCRIMHDLQGNLTKQPYGKEEQAIWSVSRAGINEQLISLAEEEPLIDVHFEHHLTQLDFDTLDSVFSTQEQESKIHHSDLFFGADGAFSKVRRLAQALPRQRISYSLDYMPQSYIELTIAANEDGSHKLEKNALHIWPRKAFMLIALPNSDGSFTCTLFLNHEGELSFESLDNREKVAGFFEDFFADALPLLDNPIDDFMHKSASPLCLVHIYPWVINNKVGLIGDAAHAMVPFYGQGMNCGFEDCRILNELIDEHEHDWDHILAAYQTERKPNGDAIIELAKRNFVEMSDLSGDSDFLLRKKIESEFNRMYPQLWVPLYSMVTFSPHQSYSSALAIGDIQNEIMDEIMQLKNIHQEWQAPHVYQLLHKLVLEKLER